MSTHRQTRRGGKPRARIVASAVAAAALGTALAAGLPAAAGGASAPARHTLVVVVSGAGRVASAPKGISCSRTCTARFAAGTRVTLVPRASKGAHFVRWGGACTAKARCTVKLSVARVVTAWFTAGSAAPPKRKPARAVAEPGSYAGQNPQNGQRIAFFVSTTGRRILNISIPYVLVSCTPAATGAPTHDSLGILAGTIRPDGSFVAKGSQKGVFGGYRAKFAYSFTGRFQAATSTQAATAAGSFRENVVYSDTTTHTCTSNTQSWTARKSGPVPQRASLVTPGNYTGQNPQNGQGIAFSVPAGGHTLVNISIPYVLVACTPAATGAPASDHLGIPRGTVKPDGSFTARASQAGVFDGVPAKFTYSFTGSFQGLDASGRGTAAGSFREDIVFTDGSGTTHTCTSDDQSWTATRTS